MKNFNTGQENKENNEKLLNDINNATKDIHTLVTEISNSKDLTYEMKKVKVDKLIIDISDYIELMDDKDFQYYKDYINENINNFMYNLIHIVKNDNDILNILIKEIKNNPDIKVENNNFIFLKSDNIDNLALQKIIETGMITTEHLKQDSKSLIEETREKLGKSYNFLNSTIKALSDYFSGKFSKIKNTIPQPSIKTKKKHEKSKNNNKPIEKRRSKKHNNGNSHNNYHYGGVNNRNKNNKNPQLKIKIKTKN